MLGWSVMKTWDIYCTESLLVHSSDIRSVMFTTYPFTKERTGVTTEMTLVIAIINECVAYLSLFVSPCSLSFPCDSLAFLKI